MANGSLLPNKDKVHEDITNDLTLQLDYLNAELDRQTLNPSIYKIPEDIKKVNPKAFKPQTVSLGPYHHGEEHLSQMETVKRFAFFDFRNRWKLSLVEIKNRVEGKLKDLLRSYNELDDKWKNEQQKFLEIMIVDGCFVLDILLKYRDLKIFVDTEVLRDMLLLENQLPMILLDELYSMIPDQNEDKKVKSLVWQFDNKPSEDGAKLPRKKYQHLLDMYAAELISEGSEWKRLQNSLVGLGHNIQPAKRFHEAGIKFKKGETNNLKNISFDKKQGVLSLPLIEMNAHVELALLNVMAFEKLYRFEKKVVSNFIVLMSYLMETDTVESFNQLAKGEVLNMLAHKLYNDVFNMVNEHCNKRWNIWRTTLTLRSTKFQNPWTIISVVAALLGFALVILQTAYQIYSCYRSYPS